MTPPNPLHQKQKCIQCQHDYKDIEIYSFQLSIATIIFLTQFQPSKVVKNNPKIEVFILKHLNGEFL